MRRVCHLHLTRQLRVLLDRKDRISMAVGLEVRVPYCDHRLVEYVYNTPWALKTFDGREKSLLRGAARDVVPQSVAERVKSAYPSIRDPAHDAALVQQVQELTVAGSHPVFEVASRRWLQRAARVDPTTLRADMRNTFEWLLNFATWLELRRPRLQLT